MKMMNMMKGKVEVEFLDDSIFIFLIFGIFIIIGCVLIGWVVDCLWLNIYFINNGLMVLVGFVIVVCFFFDGNV